MKRAHVCGLIILLILVSAAAVVTRLAIGAPISWTDFDRIQDGLTQQEVAGILGSPTEVGFYGSRLYWDGSNGRAIIQFDASGRVCGKRVMRDSDAWKAKLSAWVIRNFP